jgi:hypothetical protein
MLLFSTACLWVLMRVCIGRLVLTCRTESAVGVKISSGYKFKLFSRLCKAVERAGSTLADSLADSLACALVGPHDTEQGYSYLCFFYGTSFQGTSSRRGEDQGSQLSVPAPCVSEALVTEWHRWWNDSKHSMPATHLYGWVIIKASSNMLAGGTGMMRS